MKLKRETVAQLRDYGQRFIFQGGSEFAHGLASLIERSGMKIKLNADLVIEPQASKYYFPWGPPKRVGDIVLIHVPNDNFLYPYIEYRVILLEDASGRQWLVSAP